MSNKKKVYRWLKKQSEILPKDTYVAFHKYAVPQMDTNDKGEPMLVGGEAQRHQVNHARRLKRAFKKYGKEGVDAYFARYGFGLKPNQESQNLE